MHSIHIHTDGPGHHHHHGKLAAAGAQTPKPAGLPRSGAGAHGAVQRNCPFGNLGAFKRTKTPFIIARIRLAVYIQPRTFTIHTRARMCLLGPTWATRQRQSNQVGRPRGPPRVLVSRAGAPAAGGRGPRVPDYPTNQPNNQLTFQQSRALGPLAHQLHITKLPWPRPRPMTMTMTISLSLGPA